MLFWVAFFILGMFAGLIAGILGIGGGTIIVPGLIYLFSAQHLVVKEELMHVVLGTSLASVTFTLILATIIHSKQKNIRWSIARQLIPGLILGAIIGPYITTHLNTQVLLILFASFLFLLSLRFIFNWHSEVTFPVPKTPIMWCIGTIISALTSMLGLGGGILLVPFLSHLPLKMQEVTALSMACILPVAILATVSYIILGLNVPGLPALSTGYIYWPAVLSIMVASSFMTPLGIAWAKRLSAQKIKKFFGVFLLCVSIGLLTLG